MYLPRTDLTGIVSHPHNELARERCHCAGFSEKRHGLREVKKCDGGTQLRHLGSSHQGRPPPLQFGLTKFQAIRPGLVFTREEHKALAALNKGSANHLCKGTVHILGFAGHLLSLLHTFPYFLIPLKI